MRVILLLVLYFIDGLLGVALSNLPSIGFTLPGKNLSNCTEKYGDQPATRTKSLDGVLTIFNVCANISGHVKVLQFKDSNGDQRYACFLIKHSTKKLPLLVWLHSSLSPSSTIVLTGLVSEAKTANLTGTSDGPCGYHLLLPYGRDTTHIYPPPDNQGLGWDNWYRNYNRSDPALNVDVETIDSFIDQVLNNPSKVYRVDTSRVFMSGWSNGAALAIQYALNTPGIAAAAVYSAPDPYRDYQDPCAQVPDPPYYTPVLALYNQCDVLGICATGKAFFRDLNNRYARELIAEDMIFDSAFQNTTICDSNCTSEYGLGLTQHSRWPVTLNDKVFFNFFRQHPLL